MSQNIQLIDGYEKTTFYIYTIQNKINNKMYVGQTINLKGRWRGHKSCAFNKNDLRPLYCSMRKYSIKNFVMEALEEFDNLHECNEAEEFWIQFFQTYNRTIGYNINLGGNNRSHTKETKQKLSKMRLGTKHSE